MSKKYPAMDLAFEAWCEGRPLTPNTRRAYRREIERFAGWLEGQPSQRLAGRHLQSYLHVLTSADPKHLASAGIAKPLSHGSLLQTKRILGAFLLWLAAEGDCELSAAMVIKAWCPKPASTDLSSPSFPMLYQGHAATKVEEHISLRVLRDRCIQHIGFWSGATRQELAALETRDLRTNRGILRIRLSSRTGPTLWLNLPDICLTWWRAYRARVNRMATTTAFAFRSVPNPTQGLSSNSIARAIAQIHLSKNKPAHATLRGMRRELAAMAYQKGWRAGMLAFHLRRATAPRDIKVVTTIDPQHLEALALMATRFYRSRNKD